MERSWVPGMSMHFGHLNTWSSHLNAQRAGFPILVSAFSRDRQRRQLMTEHFGVCQAVVWQPSSLQRRLCEEGVLPDVAVDASRIHSTRLQS